MADFSATETRKVCLLFILALLLLYLSVPNLPSFKAQRQAILQEGQPLPWYMEIFPEKGCKLERNEGIAIELAFEPGLNKVFVTLGIIFAILYFLLVYF